MILLILKKKNYAVRRRCTKVFVVRRELIKLIENNKKDLIQNIRDNQGELKINNAEVENILYKIFYK